MAEQSLPSRDGDAPAAERPLFEARLTPHRSLSKRGFHVVMALVALVSLGSGLVFLAHGAWPIAGFFGLDALLLWGALTLSNRSGRASEEVRVSRTELAIRQVSPRGAVREARYNPFWARLRVDRHAEFGIERMRVTARGASTEIGAFLNPEDRESFAEAFGRALGEARRG